MHPIVWSDELKTGVPAMDAEHRQMLDLANAFLGQVAEGADAQRLGEALDRLVVHTRAHFVAEEALMDRVGYPDLAKHKSEHERLLTEARMLRGRYAAVAPDALAELTGETGDFLRRWLLDHIRETDKPYRPFLMRLA